MTDGRHSLDDLPRISLYQRRLRDAALHSMRAWKLLDTAHGLRRCARDLESLERFIEANDLRRLAAALDAQRRRIMKGPPDARR